MATNDDAVQIKRFVAGRDEVAFAELVKRHGPMVLGICRRILRDASDAEDAFQATFLVLALRAGSIRNSELLGNWLFGVATRTARHARAVASRRLSHQERHMTAQRSALTATGVDPDLSMTIDEEISRLPDKYRTVIVLCYLEGKSKREAAKELDWPEGTVATRLREAKDRLRRRLTRGVGVISAAAMIGILSRDLAAAPVPSTLFSATMKSVGSMLAGKTSMAAATATKAFQLANGVSKTMFLGKLKLLVIITVLALLTAAGAEESARRLVATAKVNRILDRSIQSQLTIRSFATHIDSETEFLHWPSWTSPAFVKAIVKEIHSLDVQVDGDRQDDREQSWTVYSNRPGMVPQYKMRGIWDGKQLLHWQEYQGEGPHQLQPSVSSHFKDLVRTRDFCGLFGRAWGDDRPMVQLLRDSGVATLHEQAEDVDGHRCQVVEGTNPNGSYVLWLDPDADYQIRRARISRKPGDLWFGQKVRASGTESTKIRVDMEIHDVVLRKMGEQWVPLQCVTDIKYLYPGGEYELYRDSAKCSGFLLDPDFNVTGAFVMSGIPDSTPVAVMDGQEGGQSGWGKWRNGQVVERHEFRPPPPHPAVGQAAPETAGQDVEGKPLRLSDFRGKVVVLVFWGPWCGPCMARVPEERSLVQSLKDRPFVLLGVADDQSPATIETAMRKEQMNWPNFYDGRGGPIEKQWGVRGLPTVYVIDANGTVRDQDPANLEEAVLNVLDGPSR